MVTQRAGLAGVPSQEQKGVPAPEQTLPLIPRQGDSSVEFFHDNVISILIQNAIGNKRTLSRC